MPDFKAVVFVEGQLRFIVATPPRRKIGLWRAVLGHVFYIMSCVEKFIQHRLGLVRSFTVVFNNFFPTGRVAKSPRPRLFKPEQASNVRQQFMTLQKKTLLHMVRRAHSSCAPNTIHIGGFLQYYSKNFSTSLQWYSVNRQYIYEGRAKISSFLCNLTIIRLLT